MSKAAPMSAEAHSFWMPSITFALWGAAVTVGVIGLLWPSGVPSRPATVLAPLQAELLNVTLTDEPAPLKPAAGPASPSSASLPPLPAPPPAATLPRTEPAPRLAEIAEVPALPEFPSPALPPVNPAQVAPDSRPTVVVPPGAPLSNAPTGVAVAVAVPGVGGTFPVQTLRYGQGEGKQPAPEYPASARREGQQGTVLVRFTVGTDGRVLAAEAVRPAPWPLLTQSALDVIRHRWRFSVGSLRAYEVSIRFQLSR